MRYKLISEKTALHYLTTEGTFLYERAILDHFDLTLPIEDRNNKKLSAILRQIIETTDLETAFGVWMWCVDTFYPYRDHEAKPGSMFNDALLVDFYHVQWDLTELLYQRTLENKYFGTILVGGYSNYCLNAGKILRWTLYRNDAATAKDLMTAMVESPYASDDTIRQAIEGTVFQLFTANDPESVNFFLTELLPIIRTWDHLPTVISKIDEWERIMKRHIF